MWVEKNGPRYRIRDWVGGRKTTLAEGYPTATAAEQARKLLEADKLRGDLLMPRGGQITLAQFVDTWLPGYLRSLKPSARHSEGGRVRNHVVARLGEYRLDDIDSLVVQTWVDTLTNTRTGKPLGPKTVANCHGVLHTILGAAVRARRIRSNPAAGTALPLREHREMMFLSEPEIAILMQAMPAHWRPMVLTLVGTGLRFGEASALRVRDAVLMGRAPALRVERSAFESSSGEILYGPPKTERSRRTVTITPEIVEVLRPLALGRARDELLFRAPMGGAVRARNFRRSWLRALPDELTGLRVHDLRHTHAGILISANRPPTYISRRLGHSSYAVTDALYGHLFPHVDAESLAAISEAMSLTTTAALAAEVGAELADEVDAA